MSAGDQSEYLMSSQKKQRNKDQYRLGVHTPENFSFARFSSLSLFTCN